MSELVCPNCKRNKGFNTGMGMGILTCSNCGQGCTPDELLQKDGWLKPRRRK